MTRGMSWKSTADRRIREAVQATLAPGEDVTFTLTGQQGVGYWPLLTGAAVIAFFVYLFTPDSFGRSIAVATLFGFAFMTWYVVAPAHGIAVTPDRLIFVRMTTFTNRPRGVAHVEPLANAATAAADPSLGWSKLVYTCHDGRRVRLTVNGAWRDEAVSLAALLNRRGTPPI